MKLSLNLQTALEEIKKRKAKRVLVQLAEGLKTHAIEIIKQLEKSHAEIIILVEPCFGACDLAEQEMKILNADLVIHLGHEQMIPSKRTVFIPLSYEIEKERMNKLLKKFEEHILRKKMKKIALCGTAQYLRHLKRFKTFGKKKGLQVFLTKNNAGILGQVLGCDVSAVKRLEKKSDCVVFLGDGLFHPLAISFAVKKPLLVINPMEENAEWFNEKAKEELLKKRILMLEKAKGSDNFGILISTKEGQAKVKKAFELKRLIERNGKKAFVFSADFLSQEHLLGINIDCFVSTACPRIALEDFVSWKKPIINSEELKILLGKKKIDDYCFEELF